MASNAEADYTETLSVVERDSTKRYLRYDKIIGKGAFKTVYKGFDVVRGIEVAWSKTKMPRKWKSKENLESLTAEANLLKSLKHENILRCYHSWVDDKTKFINMITELFTSGNLIEYIKKHKLGDNIAFKNWAIQILKGIDYLHRHDPPIIHRDIKCENIFVNGNSGKVKIGDLGLAMVLGTEGPVKIFAGTPRFMAPEMLKRYYNQLIDIYSFGMCLLQMATKEPPYSECTKDFEVYEMIRLGIKPPELSKVKDPQVKQFIEKCLASASERPTAIDLLNDPFLALSDSEALIGCINSSLRDSVCSSPSSGTPLQMVGFPATTPVKVAKRIRSEGKIYKLIMNIQDADEVHVTLWISDIGGYSTNRFVFYLKTDTTGAVVEEMTRELGLSDTDVALVTQLAEELLTELVPGSPGFAERHLKLKNIPAEKSIIEVHGDPLEIPETSGRQGEANQSNRRHTDNIVPEVAEEPSLSVTSMDISQSNQDVNQEQEEKAEDAGNNSREEEATHPKCFGNLLFPCVN